MRRGGHYLSIAALGLVLVAWVLVLRPASLGGPASYVVIRGSSMLPDLATGDLVILRSAERYDVGDVVAYQVPDGDIGEGRIVIHRIVGGNADAFSLRGDNNPAPDPWTPSVSDVVGEAWLTIPGAGRLLAALHQPVLLAALAAAIVVAMMLMRTPDGGAMRRRRVAPGASARAR